MRTIYCSTQKGVVSVIDFDRGRVRAPGAWTSRNLRRLQRSLVKMSPGLPAGPIRRRLERLLAGYEQSDAPAVHLADLPRRAFRVLAVLWRGLRDRGYWEGLAERFGWGARRDPAGHMAARRESGGNDGGRAVGAGAACPLPASPLVLTTALPPAERAPGLFGEASRCAFCPTTCRARWRDFSIASGRASPSSWKPSCGRICSTSARAAACRWCSPAQGCRPSPWRAIGVSAACFAGFSPPFP